MKVILDRSNRTAHYSAATFFDHAGISVWIDARHAIAHNKIMIIDGNTIHTGSFNFTKAAEQQNAGTLTTIYDAALTEQYAANCQKHLQHSEPYGANTTATTSSAQRAATADRGADSNSSPWSSLMYATRGEGTVVNGELYAPSVHERQWKNSKELQAGRKKL